MSFIEAFLNYEFVQRAVLAAVLGSVLCGILGSLVVINRMVFLAGSISHAAYGGVGLAIFAGWPVTVTVSGFAVAVAGVVALMTNGGRRDADVAIGALWALGMAAGVLLLDLTPGYNVDLMSYLFGSLLAIPSTDLWLMAGMALATVMLTALLFPGLAMLSADPEHARARGIPVTALYCALLLMVALGVVMLMRVAGLILIIALLTIPTWLAQRNARSLAGLMLQACLWNLLFCLAGLVLAWHGGVTTGPAIVAVAALGLFVVSVGMALRRYLRRADGPAVSARADHPTGSSAP